MGWGGHYYQRGGPGGGMVWAEAWEEGRIRAWSLVLTRGTHLQVTSVLS